MVILDDLGGKSNKQLREFREAILTYERGSIEPETVFYHGIPLLDPRARDAFLEDLRRAQENFRDPDLEN